MNATDARNEVEYEWLLISLLIKTFDSTML